MSEFAAVPDAALAALDAAMESDGMVVGEGTSVVSPPADGFDPANQGLSQGETVAPNAATPEQSEGQVAPAPDAAAEDSFTERFDPNSLPAELLPAYKAMQADYTRKRQADAEAIRLVQQYQDVDLGTAVELYQRMQDPNALLDFVQEASEYLANQGYAEWETVDSVGVQPQTAAENNLQQALDNLAAGDPDLAPLAEAVKQMQHQLESFQMEHSERLEAEREETQMLQVLGEIQRQENIIRTDNPQYGDDDIDAIYEIASYYDGDLLAAQESYEAMFTRRLGRYMGAKEATPAPVIPAGTPGGIPTPELSYDPLDSKSAHAAALETLRLIESQ